MFATVKTLDIKNGNRYFDVWGSEGNNEKRGNLYAKYTWDFFFQDLERSKIGADSIFRLSSEALWKGLHLRNWMNYIIAHYSGSGRIRSANHHRIPRYAALSCCRVGQCEAYCDFHDLLISCVSAKNSFLENATGLDPRSINIHFKLPSPSIYQRWLQKICFWPVTVYVYLRSYCKVNQSWRHILETIIIWEDSAEVHMPTLTRVLGQTW